MRRKDKIELARTFLAHYAESPRARETMTEVEYVAFRFGGIGPKAAAELIALARAAQPAKVEGGA
jgi:hypothetical protein